MFWKRYCYTSRRCKNNGRIDGKKGIPPIEQVDIPSFERELIAVAEEHLSYEVALREKRDGKLKARYCKARLQKEKRKEQISHIKAPLDEKHKKFEDAMNGLDNLESVSIWDVPHWLWIIFAFFVIAEFPLNAVVFNIFLEPQLMTWIMASSVCLAIPLSAHLFGVYIKRRYRSISISLILTLLFIIIVAAISGIAYLRGKYFEALLTLEREGSKTPEVSDILKYIKISGNEVMFFFLFIGVVIFLVVGWVAHFAHPANPTEYRNVTRRLKKAKKELRTVERNLSKAKKAFSKASNTLEEIRTKREQGISSKLDRIKRDYLSLIRVYQTANLRARGSHQRPNSFNAEVSFQTPSDLTLEWGCEFERQE